MPPTSMWHCTVWNCVSSSAVAGVLLGEGALTTVMMPGVVGRAGNCDDAADDCDAVLGVRVCAAPAGIVIKVSKGAAAASSGDGGDSGRSGVAGDPASDGREDSGSGGTADGRGSKWPSSRSHSRSSTILKFYAAISGRSINERVNK